MKIEQKEIIKKVPSYVTAVSNSLIENGFEAYLVGGSLRDIIIGREPTDYDIATNAKPDEVEQIFPKSVSTNAKFGTVIVISPDEKGENFSVEVTTYRSEEDYTGGRWPAKVEFTKSIQDDLGRRDFTINAMALNLDKNVKEEIIDLFGGVNDIKNKVIKAVGDPVERFREDGLRGFRACRLASQLSFEIEEKTFEAIKETLDTAAQVSMERVRDEFIRLVMGSPKPSVGLILLKDTGLLKLFIPELLEGIDVTQPQFHVDDVFEHSLKTVDIAEDSIKIAALFHDIGKPRTMTKDEDGNTHFYSHDVVGSDMVKEIMTRLRFPKNEIERTSRLIRWHMFYYPSADWRLEEELRKSKEKDLSAKSENVLKKRRNDTFKEGWTDGAIRRFIKNAGGEEAIDDLMKLRIADANANPKSSFHPEEIESLENRIAEVREKEMAIKISDLDLTGEDLSEVGIEKGPRMGEILNKLLDIVIDDPTINRKKVLLDIVRKRFLS